MASTEREPIIGSWGEARGEAPSGVQGQSSWSGVTGTKLPEAELVATRQTFERHIIWATAVLTTLTNR